MFVRFLNYNNYYNRIFKKENSVKDYYASPAAFQQSKRYKENICIKDGISFTKTFNNVGLDDIPDYMLITEDNGTEEVITSRWFVLEAVSEVGRNQYTLTLQRDLLADYEDEILNGTFFIEKGNVGFNNPLVYNKEEMLFNQIKQRDIELKDETGCPWIVAYLSRNTPEQKGKYLPTIIPDYELDMLSKDWEYHDYTATPFKFYPNPDSYFQLVFTNSTLTTQKFINFSINGQVSSSWRNGAFFNGLRFDTIAGIFDQPYPSTQQAQARFPNSIIQGYFNDLFVSKGYYKTQAATEDLKKYQNKIIQFKDGLYMVRFETSNYSATPALWETDGDYKARIYDRCSGWGFTTKNGNWATYYGTSGNGANLVVKGTQAKIILEKIADAAEKTYYWKIPSISARPHLIDAPYDMLCMPYGKMTIHKGDEVLETDAEVEIRTINAIIGELTAGKDSPIYDVQLLPYCPLPKAVYSNTDIYLDNYPNNTFYIPITKGGDVEETEDGTWEEPEGTTAVGYMFFVDKSSFTVDIPFEPIVIDNPKLESNTDMYRIVSPNFNGQFEFNAAMNEGIRYFQADCSYLPYGPYINVRPDFKGLYGGEFNDARGLICGGDFSLPIVNEAWSQYKLNNKNFQQIFDRQIESMNLQHTVAQTQDIVNAITGTAQGGVSGATIGLTSTGGNPYAGIAGAVAGTAASAAGGIADIFINKQLRDDARDLTHDQFQYQLGNVRAMPNSLARVSSFNIDNRYFPILEIYSCSPEEKRVFANKIAYNGMKVNAIGRIEDYLNDWSYTDEEGNVIESEKYIKGKLLRINLKDDTHIIQQIAEEMNKGVYFK